MRRRRGRALTLAGALTMVACSSQRSSSPAVQAPVSARPQPPAVASNQEPPSTLTAAEIDASIRAQNASLLACYQSQLDVEPNLAEGKLILRFQITAQGAVQNAQVNHTTSTFTHPVVAQCVVDIFLHLQFPAKGGGIVNYPLQFSHAKGA